MSDRRPIEAEQDLGDEDEEAAVGVSPEAFKEALSYHATGVTIVAVRDGPTVYGTTVSSFMPISVEPPLVLVSVSGNAPVLPFLDEGKPFVVNLLRSEQKPLATVYADVFPVGPSPFPPEGDPVIEGSLAVLRCRVESVIEVDDIRLVLGRVMETGIGEGGDVLVHYRRGYHVLE